MTFKLLTPMHCSIDEILDTFMTSSRREEGVDVALTLITARHIENSMSQYARFVQYSSSILRTHMKTTFLMYFYDHQSIVYTILKNT